MQSLFHLTNIYIKKKGQAIIDAIDGKTETESYLPSYHSLNEIAGERIDDKI